MKTLITGILLLGMAICANAQSAEFQLDRRFVEGSFGEIISDNAVQGYYFIQKLEKISRKEAVYEITLMDDNLRETAKYQIRRPKKSYLLETVFNNEVFVFHFYDAKAKSLEVISIDRTGNQVGSYKVEDPNKYMLAGITTAIQTEEEYLTVYEMGSAGFMYLETVKNKDYGFVVHGLDNKMNEIWSYSSDTESKMAFLASVLSVDENYALLMVMEKKQIYTQKFDSYVVLIDTKSGEVKYNFQMQDDNEAQLSVLNGFVDPETGIALVVGEYYAPGDDVAKDKSLGLYMRGVETNGEYSVYKKYGWDDEIARVKRSTMTEEQEEANKKDVELLYFHRIIRRENGSIYAIAEQFRKQVSAGGTALKVLAAAGGGSSGASAFELLVTNMVVLEFDKDLNMTNFEIVGKKKSNVLLPAGAGWYSAQMLGNYVKVRGGFDYAFTTEDKKTNAHFAVYSDMNRREDEDSKKSDGMIGVISISPEGEIEKRRIPLNSDATKYRFRRAKPGYILVREYFKREKKLKLRIEKVG